MKRFIIALLVLLTGVVQCGPESHHFADSEVLSDPIVGGSLEPGFPLVGLMGVRTGRRQLNPFCTAIATTPNVVLTAGHCNSRIEESGDLPIAVVFYHDEEWATFHDVDRAGLRTYPGFVSGQDPPHLDDIGLATLVQPLRYQVFPELRREALTELDEGTELTVIGFGATATGSYDLGVKRSIEMEISEVPLGPTEYFVVAVPGDASLGTCNGDSGGAGLVVNADRDLQVGVHARAHIREGSDWLCGEGEQSSVPHFYAGFIEPTVLELDPLAAECGDLLCTGIERADECPEDCDFSTCGRSRERKRRNRVPH